MNKLISRIILGKSWRRTLARAGVWGVVTFIIFKFLFLPVRINGISMEPTYRNGSINLINTFRYCFRVPQRGDIVAIRMAGQRVMLFKRVLGLPGERLRLDKGVLMVNNVVIDEPYVKNGCDWDLSELTMGPDEFFMVGDNRSMPIEAHTHGRAESRRIIGGPLF